MKGKVTKIACTFAVKLLRSKNISWELSNEGNTFSKTTVTESVFTKILSYI